MNLPPSTWRFGTLKLALVMASIGFALALATSTPSRASATALAVGPRVLATNCTRLPTEFVTDSDLGAVVVGSQFTRQILTRFGFRPHTYSFGQVANFDGTLGITSGGKLTGEFKSGGPNVFQVNVTDSAIEVPPPPISKLFFLNAVDQQYSEAPLHFETGSPISFGTTEQSITLPRAVAGDVYFYSFQANGGVPPYKLTVLEQKTKRFLPQGLAFDSTKNLIYGKPVTPTLFGSPAIIEVLLSDKTGQQVTGHFSLDILPGTITSHAIATAGQLNLFFGIGKAVDTVSFTLLLDKSEINARGIRLPSDLNGLPIELTFGGVKLPPDPPKGSSQTRDNTFDSQGRIDVPKKHLVLGDVVGQNKGDPTYSIHFDPRSGVLAGTFTGLDIIRDIGANFLTFEGQFDRLNRGPVIPINVRIGLVTDMTLDEQTDVLETTDVIKFVYKRSGSGSTGHGSARMNDNIAPAGIFLINKVSGSEQRVVVDSVNNLTEDRIFLQLKGLMRQPGAQPVVPQTNDQVSVFINRVCLGMFPASSFAAKGDQLIFMNADPTKGLKDLVIDNKKGTVLITTHGLNPSTDLFGSDILVAGVPETVPVTLTIGGPDLHSPTFDGQSTITVFRKGTSIVNK